MDPAAPGELNRRVGWTLLVLGFAWAAWLDPWSLSETDPAALPGSARMASRHAQAVVIGMAVLQLAAGRLPLGEWLLTGASRAALRLTAAGAALYALGYVLSVTLPAGAWLVPAGAAMNLVGFGTLALAAGKGGAPGPARFVLPVIAFGMALDIGMGLFALAPDVFLPAYLGAEDGVRLRMLRLARAAAIALPTLALLYDGLAARAGSGRRGIVRLGGIALAAGAAGMPAILVLAALTTPHLKYLLGVPADAVLAGALIGAWLARRHAPGLEAWGWALAAASMGVGLLMGGYAFDGPLASPAFLGGYNDYVRRLTRLGHAYAIVLGIVWIMAAREREHRASARGDRAGTSLLVAGAAATLGGIFAAAVFRQPAVLSAGPALVAVGLALIRAGRKQGP